MTVFAIRPSYESTAGTLAYVVIVFTMYILFVGYMASYDLAYIPNTAMLGDLVFGNDAESYNKFKTYLKQTCKKEPFTPTREETATTTTTTTSWFEDAVNRFWFMPNDHTVKVRNKDA